MKKRAQLLGLKFNGRKNFILPSHIKILNNSIPIKYPQESGAFIDFISIFLEDAYNLDSIKEPITSIIDIGGNLGFFSLAARNKFPNARIHLYEPNPHLNIYLTNNIKDLEITYYKEALGGNYNNISLDFNGDSNQTRSNFDTKGGIEQIPLFKAIDRMEGVIDFAKIDCEGGEWEMMKDLEPWKKIKWLAMEYHLWNGNSFVEINEKFSQIGFRIIKHSPMDGYGHIWAKNIHL